MYGQMYCEQKLKPFVDQAHDAAHQECESKKETTADGEQGKEPLRIVSWTAVAMEHYEKETEDIKQEVRNAVEEHAKLTRDGTPLDGDPDGKIVQLEE